ncbi:uncharacterized protein LOC135927041 [Gordionus sp. m RMFG-2023]|uniref:uncharacterized protein LOC135927041 n=1 Tax=Gordionus sp. m RMFG-2023 TaxID=3053472 RepID=UPI0031FDEC40
MGAQTAVPTDYGDSESFEMKVGLHQGSVLSSLLFILVMDVVTREMREGLPWELLYADDLVLMANSEEELRDKFSYGNKGHENEYIYSKDKNKGDDWWGKLKDGGIRCIKGVHNNDNVENDGLDIGNGLTLGKVDKFCYLGDMLNADGGADSALVARVRQVWKKFRHLF